MKVEEIHGQDFATRAAAKHCVFADIEGWYNTTFAFEPGIQIARTV